MLARILAPLILASALSAQTEWIQQFGTTGADSAEAAAIDGVGGVYVGGWTGGSFAGPSLGLRDAWLARHDASGNRLWLRQFGTTVGEECYAAAPDGSGGVIVGGRTLGSLGGPDSGTRDAWAARFDAGGNQLWARQLGTSFDDECHAIAIDGVGGAFVCGWTTGSLGAPSAGTRDAWIARLDANGNQLWIRQIGTSAMDEATAAASDASGDVYVSGWSGGALGGPHLGNVDAWLARYDALGNQQWIRQLGTSAQDEARAAATDGAGGVFVAGWTGGSLGAPYLGNFDAWLARYDALGNQVWVKQFGTTADDQLSALTADGSGGAFVGGYSNGNPGGPSAGWYDAWLSRYDANGARLWTRQRGTPSDDRIYALAPDAAGGVFTAGYTPGSLGGPLIGAGDAWLARDGYFVCYVDADLDGVGAGAPATVLASCGIGFSPLSNDCNDSDATVYPGAPELCDGIDNNCDGVNNDGLVTTYCTAGTSIYGCVPSISGVGAPSSTESSGFTLQIHNVPAERYGLFFYGSAPTAQIWSPGSSSYFCVFFPISRTGVLDSGGTPGTCEGVFSLDWNAWRSANPTGHGSPFAAGEVFYAQGWYRDPGAAQQTNLSNGLRFTLCE